MLPTLSIITPCLNAECTIRETIESVLRQDTEGVEYIIIDGGSTDGTLNIIKEYTDSIQYLVSEPDKGVSDAFNKGINVASGEYIGIINADDYYEPNAFQLIKLAAQKKPDIIHGSLRYISKHSQYVEHPNPDRIWCYMSIFHPTMFIHRDAYKTNGLYNLRYAYAMDSEWVHRALVNNLKMAQLPTIISNMRLGGKSHKHFFNSLVEFRRSVITHSGKWLRANYYFIRQIIVQALISINWVKQLRLRKRPL